MQDADVRRQESTAVLGADERKTDRHGRRAKRRNNVNLIVYHSEPGFGEHVTCAANAF